MSYLTVGVILVLISASAGLVFTIPSTFGDILKWSFCPKFALHPIMANNIKSSVSETE